MMNKQQSRHRRISAAIIFTVLLTVLSSCGGETTPEDTTEQNTAPLGTETAAEEVEPNNDVDRNAIPDELPEAGFGGADYRIFCYNGSKPEYYEIEKQTGDTIDDAVFERNCTIEERFNCKIKVALVCDYDAATKTIGDFVTAGDDVYDIVANHVVQTGVLVPNGYFLNWYDIPHINFDKPWWSDSNKNDLTINGKCFIAMGDMLITAVGCTYCVFYNKQIGQNYDMPDMFSIINDGKWTFDKMVEFSKDIYEDLNQNGQVDSMEDRFGYVTNTLSNINAYLWAFDNPIYKTKNGTLTYTFHSEKINDIASRLVDAFYNYNGLHTDLAYSHDYSRNMFRLGNAMFANGVISDSIDYFRDLTDDFSILPYPKWNEEQENYITMVDGSHECMMIPVTATELERIGIITEALCAESYKQVFPAYYDVALKVKGARDVESVAMLDRIMQSRVFDFGYVYDGWKGASFILQKLVQTKNNNFESFYAAKEQSILEYYDSMISYFNEYDG